MTFTASGLGADVCAGPYAHRLLRIDRAALEVFRGDLAAGPELQKPGSVRLNLAYPMEDAAVDYIVQSVDTLAHSTDDWLGHYAVDPATARFEPFGQAA